MIPGFIRRWLTPAPPPEIPELTWQRVLKHSPILQPLNTDERARLKVLTEGFLARKEFSGAHGLQLNDTMCTTIAAQACLLVLEIGLEAYAGWVGIVVYPAAFVVPRQIEDEDGVVHEFDDAVSGEAWSGGPVLISWEDTREADPHYNVVLHEFAHKLDMLNGEADGIPTLPPGLSAADWVAAFDPAYEDFCQRVDTGQDTIIDPYAAEHPSEFFAVLSETFFGDPHVVAAEYPAVYTLLTRFYRQDPLRRGQH